MDSSMAERVATRQVPEFSVISSAALTDLLPLPRLPSGCLICMETLSKTPSPLIVRKLGVGGGTRSGAHHLPSFSLWLRVRGVVWGATDAKFTGLIPGPIPWGQACLAVCTEDYQENAPPWAQMRPQENLSLGVFVHVSMCSHLS